MSPAAVRSLSFEAAIRGSTAVSATAYVKLIDGSAVYGQDYAAYDSNDNRLTGPVVAVPFSAYQTSQTLLLVGAVNATKTLTLQLVSGSSSAAFGKAKTTTVTFLDSQNPNGILGFSPASYVVDESSGHASLTVTRTGTVGIVQFQCTTVPGTAKAKADYTKIDGEWFAFADGTNVATVTIPLGNDKAASPASRSFHIELSNVNGGGTIGTGSTATVTIIEQNNPKGIFEFETPAYSFDENAGWAELVVLRKAGTAGAADVLVGTTDTTGTNIGREVVYGWPSPSSTYGFPREYYGESGLADELWDWLELDEDDRELLARYNDATGNDGTIKDAREAFMGAAESEGDFAERLAEECGDVPKDLLTWIVIDWEASWRCNLRFDFSTSRAEDGAIWFFHD